MAFLFKMSPVSFRYMTTCNTFSVLFFIDYMLKFDINTKGICRKGLQRFNFLWKLDLFNVDRVMMSFLQVFCSVCPWL